MKKVTITFSRPPKGTAHFSEGLRLASGMALNDHETRLVFIGNGAFCSLKNIDNTESEPFWKTIAEFNYPIYVEKESLEKRKINLPDIDPKFKVISRKEVSEILRDCDIHLGV
jgi:sulfur relay (sulfurtransferase) DsrF/TusC family protein